MKSKKEASKYYCTNIIIFQATTLTGQFKQGIGCSDEAALMQEANSHRTRKTGRESLVFSLTDNLSGMATDKVEQHDKLLCINVSFYFIVGNSLEKEDCWGEGG